MVETARRRVVRCTAPCRLPPTQIDLVTGGGSFALSMCAVATHRNARAIAPTTISTAAKAIVNASIKSVSISDLYIASPLCGESPKGATVRDGQGCPKAQTCQLRQFAWANSRQICDRHNCANNYELLITQHQGVRNFAFTLCEKRLVLVPKRSRLRVRCITQCVFDVDIVRLHNGVAADRHRTIASFYYDPARSPQG
jgi:hypothetical protein